ALIALATTLALTGPDLAGQYSRGITACTQDNNCDRFFDQFFDEYQTPFLAVTLVVLLLPALIGIFWGAPLITRELEADTHLLVWNQSITRTRWLAVKLALTGLTATAAAGLCGLAVTWWSGPLDKSAVGGFAQLNPLVFAARGIVPLGYAAFAFMLGVTVGMLIHRTLPAMALTLAVFTALQIAMPLLVRPYLLPPVHTAFELSRSNVDQFLVPRDEDSVHVLLEARVPGDPGAWAFSSHLTDPSGRPVDDAGGATLPVSTSSGPCAPPSGQERDKQGMEACVAEINRLGYRQDATYHPSSRFWTFQWYETGIYLALTLALTGFCFWWIRRRLS
ncbi:ABC transporter permease, partial [Nonomuraea sp. NPDC046570]|uniref:ABC transporter permease n=1 Tax=Nonomuraea sp. NPDC046570 TaxID=3155255 RepID=UPI0033FEDAE4